jgi:hypothetical protein
MNIFNRIKSWFVKLKLSSIKQPYKSQVVEAPKPYRKRWQAPVDDKIWTREEWKKRKRQRQLAKYHRLINVG